MPSPVSLLMRLFPIQYFVLAIYFTVILLFFMMIIAAYIRKIKGQWFLPPIILMTNRKWLIEGRHSLKLTLTLFLPSSDNFIKSLIVWNFHFFFLLKDFKDRNNQITEYPTFLSNLSNKEVHRRLFNFTTSREFHPISGNSYVTCAKRRDNACIHS